MTTTHLTRRREANYYLAICVDELVDEYGEQRTDEITRSARQALRELSGSIATESLPEMVTRLVRVRLGPPVLR